jgi:hypothetical protein
MEPFKKVLFGVVFWSVLGVGMSGVGIYAGLATSGWKRAVAAIVAFVGVVTLLGALRTVLEYCSFCI